MHEEVIAANLLGGRVCDTCACRKSSDGDYCVQWLGEACGWQWMPRDKKGTCVLWEEKK